MSHLNVESGTRGQNVLPRPWNSALLPHKHTLTHINPCCCAPCWESEAIMDDTGQAINENEMGTGRAEVWETYTHYFCSSHTFDSHIDLLPSFVLKHPVQSLSLSVCLMTESDSWSAACWLPLICNRQICSQIHVCLCARLLLCNNILL